MSLKKTNDNNPKNEYMVEKKVTEIVYAIGIVYLKNILNKKVMEQYTTSYGIKNFESKILHILSFIIKSS